MQALLLLLFFLKKNCSILADLKFWIYCLDLSSGLGFHILRFFFVFGIVLCFEELCFHCRSSFCVSGMWFRLVFLCIGKEMGKKDNVREKRKLCLKVRGDLGNIKRIESKWMRIYWNLNGIFSFPCYVTDCVLFSMWFEQLEIEVETLAFWILISFLVFFGLQLYYFIYLKSHRL